MRLVNAFLRDPAKLLPNPKAPEVKTGQQHDKLEHSPPYLGRFVSMPRLVTYPDGKTSLMMNVLMDEKRGQTFLIVSQCMTQLDMMMNRWVQIIDKIQVQVGVNHFDCLILADRSWLEPTADPTYGDILVNLPRMRTFWRQLKTGKIVKGISDTNTILSLYMKGAFLHISQNRLLSTALLNLAIIHTRRKDARTGVLFAFTCLLIAQSREAAYVISYCLSAWGYVEYSEYWRRLSDSQLTYPTMPVEDELYCQVITNEERKRLGRNSKPVYRITEAEHMDRTAQLFLICSDHCLGISSQLHAPNKDVDSDNDSGNNLSPWEEMAKATTYFMDFKWSEAMQLYYRVVARYGVLESLLLDMDEAIVESGSLKEPHKNLRVRFAATANVLGKDQLRWRKIRSEFAYTQAPVGKGDEAAEFVAALGGDAKSRESFFEYRETVAATRGYYSGALSMKIEPPTETTDFEYKNFLFFVTTVPSVGFLNAARMNPLGWDAEQILRWLAYYEPVHSLLQLPRRKYSNDLFHGFYIAYAEKYRNPGSAFSYPDLPQSSLDRRPNLNNVSGLAARYDRMMFRPDELRDIAENTARYGCDPLNDYRFSLRSFLGNIENRATKAMWFLLNADKLENIYVYMISYNPSTAALTVAYVYTKSHFQRPVSSVGEGRNEVTMPESLFYTFKNVLEGNERLVLPELIKSSMLKGPEWRLSVILPPNPPPHPATYIKSKLRQDLSCSGCSISLTADPDLVLTACGGCGGVRYCSRECQNAHWKAGHRRLCKAETGEELRPEWDGFVFKLGNGVVNLYGEKPSMVTIRTGFKSWMEKVKKKEVLIWDPNIYVLDKTKRISLKVGSDNAYYAAMKDLVVSSGVPYRDDLRGRAIYCKAEREGKFLFVSREAIPIDDVECWWF
jgi:hypothetical protein